MFRSAILVLFGVFFIAGTIHGGEIADQSFGYTINLPDKWKRVIVSANQHNFIDTTDSLKGLVSIVRYKFSRDTFPSSKSWTRAHFIAYQIMVQYSVDPYGTMLYYDTVSAKQGDLWATETISSFHSIDTVLGSWYEYIRFTASGSYGFELYAISDSADFDKNVGAYAAIIHAIKLPPDVAKIFQKFTPPRAIRKATAPGIYTDPLGRLQRTKRNAAPGIICTQSKRSVRFSK